ncbi:metallophosphoesterase [Candidatus Woesearchaeota archaeon]|jgi:uncharacterized protein|nr:metallophosphoesterase [Candidatus Woesearchaeota archaeon]
MEIINGVRILDLCLYFVEEKVLVLGDVHIGYEEALNKEGVLVPRYQFEDIMQRLKRVFEGLDVEKVVVNGDLKHEFGTISATEWRHTLKLLEFLLSKGEVVLVKGNHDVILGPIADKKNVEVVDSVRIGEGLIIHGDKLVEIPSEVKFLIIGHEHPAVTISEYPRMEKYKCFLLGKFSGKDLVVMPSFNLVTEGTNVLQGELLSPFLEDVSNFNVFIVGEEKVYSFGKVKELN